MRIKTLDELRTPDQRTLAFTPMGLGVGVQMYPEDSAEYQQEVVARFDLAPEVGQGTRQSFDQLLAVFAYGVLCYDVFTLVNAQALLVLEQALGERLVELHPQGVPFVDGSGDEDVLPALNYQQIVSYLKENRRHRRIRMPDGSIIRFDGSLHALYSWARDLGLLLGQRNRATERVTRSLRNMAAHPTGYQLMTPVDTARTLSDLAEIINQLWGQPTTGGRLYPAPIQRVVLLLAWDSQESQSWKSLAAQPPVLTPEDEASEWDCLLLRTPSTGHLPAHDVEYFDSLHEVTHYPVDLVWGPGKVRDAIAWHTEHQPQPDECDYLDRTFLIRQHHTQLYLPMRPGVAATLEDEGRPGTWYAVRADHPMDAYNHVRNILTGACTSTGSCDSCPAESIDHGSHSRVMAVIEADQRVTPADVQTPWSLPRSRTFAT